MPRLLAVAQETAKAVTARTARAPKAGRANRRSQAGIGVGDEGEFMMEAGLKGETIHEGTQGSRPAERVTNRTGLVRNPMGCPARMG